MSLLGWIASASAIGCVMAGALWLGFRWMMSSHHVPGQLAARMRHDQTPYLAKTVSDPNHQGEEFLVMSDGIRIHMFRVGSGPIPVIVLHGGPGAPPKKAWKGVDVFLKLKKGDQNLDRKFSFYFFDQRGSGLSTKPCDSWENTSSRHTGENIKKLVQVLGVTRCLEDIECIRRTILSRPEHSKSTKVVVLGHSFGGLIATLYATEFPEVIAGLLLVAPAVMLKTPGKDLFQLMEEELAKDKTQEGLAALTQVQNYSKRLKSAFSFKQTESSLMAFNDEIRPLYAAAMSRKSPQFVEHLTSEAASNHPFAGWAAWGLYVSMGLYHDYRPAVRNAAKRSPFPSLTIHCELDLQTENMSFEYADLLYGARKTMPGCCHFPMSECPQEFADSISPFLLSLLSV